MRPVERPPEQLRELPESTREFLAAMRPDELKRLQFVIEEFSKDDLEVIRDSLENLRAMKRFGRFGLWLFGFMVAGASAAAVIKTYFGGGPK